MKYYVIEISEGDAKIAGKGIYEYDSRDGAVASFHSKIGTAMKSELYITHLIMVINSVGGQEMTNVWKRALPEFNEE